MNHSVRPIRGHGHMPTPSSDLLAIRAALRPGLHLIPALAIAYACLLPREFEFEAGGITLSPTRIASLLMLPLVLMILKRRPLKFSPVDGLAGLLFAWYSISAYAIDGFPIAINRGFAYSTDQLLVYIIGRVSMQSHDDLRRLLILFLPGIMASGLFMVIESISGEHILRPTIAALLGLPSPTIPIEFRLTLLRAVGPFLHPILAGLFLAAFVPLYWGAMKGLSHLQKLGIGSGFLCVFALSAGPLLALVIAAGSIAALLLQRRLRIPIFAIGAAAAAVVMVAIQLLSENGILNVVLRYLTFGSTSSGYRTFIWEYGLIEVTNNPLFGIGARDWIRPLWMVHDTVDAYWLLVAMRYGLPAAILALLIPMIVMISLARSGARLPISAAREMQNGIVISLGIFVFCGFTVNLWDIAIVLFLLMSSIGVSLSQLANERAGASLAHGRRIQNVGQGQWRNHPANASQTIRT